MRKLTVRLDERDQALPGRADYLQAARISSSTFWWRESKVSLKEVIGVTEFMISWVKTVSAYP